MILQTNDLCSTVHISGACNSNPFAADWGPNNVICFAVDDGIGILKPDLIHGAPGKIQNTSFHHNGRVNAVKWIRSLENGVENAFISASVDTTAVVWVLDGEDNYTPKYTLGGHTHAVIDVNAVTFKLPNGSRCTLAATISIDTLMVWKKSEQDETFTLLDEFHFPEIGLGVSGISFALLPDTQTVIFACPKKFVDVSLYTCPLPFKDDGTHAFEEQEVLTGHTNWINDLTFTTADDNTLLLASASHDCTIRIWRISLKQTDQDRLGLRESIVFAENKRFSITLCSILQGHDQWVYTLQWKHFDKEEKVEDRLKLLSVSADKSAVIWQRDIAADTWIENYHLGDVGGNLSGFLGGRFDPSGRFLMCHDLLGAFHVWKHDVNSDSWTPAVLPSGHNDDVTDIQWDPLGQFLVSVSADKTTRLHAPWRSDPSCWYEFARPQTHGHVISCLTVLPQCRFVSGAAEKELRSFIAPKNFIKSFKNSSFLEDFDESKYPHNSAILPSLDLSNKPADEVENINIESSYCNGVKDIDERIIPTEDELSRNTLWPEIQKLYYHPNDISCVTSNSDGSLIASACKANSPKEASIVIWSVKKWDEIERIQELWFHQLTVTQLAFSPDGLYLLSVSRDRTWSLFKKNDNENTFTSFAFSSKTNGIHKRQINSCAWSHDSKYFVTSSRDGKVVIWARDESQLAGAEKSAESSLNGYSNRHVLAAFDGNIATVTFAPGYVGSSEYLLAAGSSSGEIGLYVWNGKECRNWQLLNGNSAHHKAVTRVVFRPMLGVLDSPHKRNILQLASAGADRLIKIYNLDVSHIGSPPSQ